jgi:GNAT superfamily N-acetyltransferase
LDTQQVLELTHLIWEGMDYVPYVWEEWLSDYQGMLAVAEFGGKVIGLGKLSLLAPGQWWLEGLRVHPDFQGRGVGTHLHDYHFKHWLRAGDGVLRLTTGSNRLAVHRMSEHTGFVKVGEFTPFRAATLDEPGEAFNLVAEKDIPRAVAFARSSESLQMTTHFMDLGWRWVTVNPHNLGEAIARERAWWWRRGEGLLAVWDDDWEEETSAVLMFIACELAKIVEMLVDFRQLAGTMKHKHAAWFAPPIDNLIPLLEEAGYKRDGEHSLYVFERHHP